MTIRGPNIYRVRRRSSAGPTVLGPCTIQQEFIMLTRSTRPSDRVPEGTQFVRTVSPMLRHHLPQ